jgi:pyrroloquinoline quinone biosynthesis protein E
MASPEKPAPRSQHSGTLAVEVTSRCNRACLYCYNTWRAGGPPPDEPELDSEELVRVAAAAAWAAGRGRIQLSGGEPLLRSDLFDVAAGFRKLGFGVSLVTDGGLLDERAVTAVKKLGLGPVQPTLLAADRSLHNRLKGADAFDATVEAVARLVRAGIPVSVSFVCTRLNYKHFMEVIELSFALGVRTVALSRFCAAGAGAARLSELQPEPAMIAECLAAGEQANARLGMKVQIAISLPLVLADTRAYPHLRFGRCALATPEPGFTVDPWGRLRACSVSPVILGDLRREPWEEIMAGAGASYFAQVSQVPAACRGCPAEGRCGGGCRESARGAWDDLAHADPLCGPPSTR